MLRASSAPGCRGVCSVMPRKLVVAQAFRLRSGLSGHAALRLRQGKLRYYEQGSYQKLRHTNAEEPRRPVQLAAAATGSSLRARLRDRASPAAIASLASVDVTRLPLDSPSL